MIDSSRLENRDLQIAIVDTVSLSFAVKPYPLRSRISLELTLSYLI